MGYNYQLGCPPIQARRVLSGGNKYLYSRPKYPISRSKELGHFPFSGLCHKCS